MHEPAEGGVGFNSEGIAFYPTPDGNAMIVQFTEVYEVNNTPVTRIEVSKPAGSASLMGQITLRIEDYNQSIYVFLNDDPFIRIDLQDKYETNNSAGTVYDADMNIVGTFSDMEVAEKGKIGLAQRDATQKWRASLRF